MSINPFLLNMFCIALLVILFLFTKLRRVRGQMSIIKERLPLTALLIRKLYLQYCFQNPCSNTGIFQFVKFLLAAKT